MKINLKRCIALLLGFGFVLSASACMMMPNQNTNNTESSSSKKNSSKKDKNSSKEDDESSEDGLDYSDYVDFVVEVEEGRNARVLQLTDPQLIDNTQAEPGAVSSIYSPDKTEEYCYRYIRQVVERYDPDLILMTGDIVYGQFDNNGSMLTELIEFMEGFDIPWAPVFGNHDNESKMGADWQCEQFENAENCLFLKRELTGNGNYSVGIVQGDKLQRVFFMMDSNGCELASAESVANGQTKTNPGFGSDQIDWYMQEAKEIKEVSPKTKFSFAFHIQIDAFRYAYEKYGTYDENNFEAFDLESNETALNGGDFGYMGRDMKGAWDKNNIVWDSFMEIGVDSIFVGHEHCNSASIIVDGVRLQFGQKSSQYDRFNKWLNGQIVGSYDHEGDPIMGGTKISLSKTNGAIMGDTGLILWDPELDK